MILSHAIGVALGIAASVDVLYLNISCSATEIHCASIIRPCVFGDQLTFPTAPPRGWQIKVCREMSWWLFDGLAMKFGGVCIFLLFSCFWDFLDCSWFVAACYRETTPDFLENTAIVSKAVPEATVRWSAESLDRWVKSSVTADHCAWLHRVLLLKFQMQRPLSGCFFSEAESIIIIFDCKCFFFSSRGLHKRASCEYTKWRRSQTPFLQLQTHRSRFTCCICVMDAGLTFSRWDKVWCRRCSLSLFPPTRRAPKSHITKSTMCRAVCSSKSLHRCYLKKKKK